MNDLCVGRIVTATTAIGRHPAIVLSTQEESDETGEVFVVPISSNNTISLEEDLIKVPPRLGMTKPCWVQCGDSEVIPVRNIDKVWPRKAWDPFLLEVRTKVQTAIARDADAKKADEESTQS